MNAAKGVLPVRLLCVGSIDFMGGQCTKLLHLSCRKPCQDVPIVFALFRVFTNCLFFGLGVLGDACFGAKVCDVSEVFI